VAGSCESGNEASGSVTTELVSCGLFNDAFSVSTTIHRRMKG
jgi:hypothetical protein